MWWPIAVLFSPLFWILIVVEVGYLFWCVEDEKPGRAFWSMVLLSLILWLFGDFNIWLYLKAHPDEIVKWTIAYIGIGFAWGVIKYFFYLNKIRRDYKEVKSQYMKDCGLTEMTGSDLKAMHSNYRYETPTYEATADNKSRIITWMTYWPVSLIWTVLRDFVLEVFEVVWSWTKHVFKGMRNKILGELIADNKLREKEM